MATLYKRGDAYYLNWRHDGRQNRVSLGKIEKRQAEALRAEKEAELRGLITVTRGVLVGDVMASYMVWYRIHRPTTYKRAVSALKRFRAAFDGAAAESLPPSLIEQWAGDEKAKGQSEKALKLARAAFRKAVAQRVIARSPMDGVAIPKSLNSRAPPYYKPDELRKMARTPNGAVWIFAAATGLRRGELAKARREDVRDGQILVESTAEGRTKSGKWRAIPLNVYARRALRHLGDDLLVGWAVDTIGRRFTADARSVGLKGSLHWLRHTFCTSLAQQGVSLHDIKALAGHSSVAVTEIYAHHQPGYGHAAVATMGAWGRAKRSDKHTNKHSSRVKPRPRSSAG